MGKDDRRRGTVWIAWDEGFAGDEGCYWGYWDLEPDGPVRALEQMPDQRVAKEAIAWGRARAHRVHIQPESDPHRYYWAGDGEPPNDLAPFPTYELS